MAVAMGKPRAAVALALLLSVPAAAAAGRVQGMGTRCSWAQKINKNAPLFQLLVCARRLVLTEIRGSH